MIDSGHIGKGTRGVSNEAHPGEPRSRHLWFVPAIMLGAFLAAFALILWVTNENSLKAKRNELAVKAETLEKTLRLSLEGHRAYLLMLAMERSAGKLSAELFQERASQYVKTHPELINITWVDARFFIRDVAPLANNRQIVGLQLNLPEPKRVSRLAMELRRPLYTRPFEAIQGRPSFEIWVPVYRGVTFLGLLGGVYSCERLLEKLAPRVESRLYHLSLVDASDGVLGELPLTGEPDKRLVHLDQVTPADSGVILRSEGYHSGPDWLLSLLELLSLTLVIAMAHALWQLKVEIEERKRAEEALKEQAVLLEAEVAERQMAQETLQEQASILEEEIAERWQAEESLTQSEEKLRLILDSTGEAIYGIDLQGRCSFCNAACLKILGYGDPDDLLGNDMHLLIHHSYRDGTPFPAEAYRILQTLQRGEIAHADDEVLWRSDGSCFAAEYWSYPQFKEEEVIGAVVTFTNITERKLLEEQFRQSQKMESIGRLAGGVAHDFNNMLSVILGAAELSKCKVAEGDPVWQYLELISKAAKRSSEITRQLLAFSRKEVISPKPLNLNRQIVESEKILARLISEEITLSFRPSGNLWTVLFDPSQVDQILMNLSVNACDAMPDGGSLTIETSNVQVSGDYSYFQANAKQGEYVQLTVSDTGVGMDRVTREHIFEPFYTTKGIGKGTGLGLATVYGIVTQNNGFVDVHSEPGQGTVFKIFLPRLNEEVLAEEKEEAVAPVFSGTILLVEDEEMLLWMASKLLEEIGYRVIQADTPQAAIDICEKGDRTIELILTDVVMPGMNGSEMVNKIKQIRPELKVLFMSGYTAEIVAQRGIVDEGMHYIQKPLDMKRLSEKILEVLAQR